MKFCDNVGDPSYFPMPLPDCLFYVTFRSADFRHEVSKSSKNRTNVSFFGPQFFSGWTTPTFLRHIVSATYRPPFDKVWLSNDYSVAFADLR